MKRQPEPIKTQILLAIKYLTLIQMPPDFGSEYMEISSEQIVRILGSVEQEIGQELGKIQTLSRP